MPQLKAVDLFCGAGGTTSGAESSGHVSVALAVNHWNTAIQTHRANHPHVQHVQAPIDLVDPREFAGSGINLLMASPECIFHSNARGGRPVDDQRRSTAWCVPRWVEVLRPKWGVIENVREFEDWGPLGCDNRPLKSKKGEIFDAWINSIRALNYDVEWKLLNAADYGGATKRIRLFIVFRRGHSRKPVPFPVATHAKGNWTPAASIIDWSLPCPSIFGRKRPLADKTLRRIEIGLRKFCGPGAAAFVVRLRRNGTASPVEEPLGTVTAGGNHEGLAVPFQLQLIGRGAGRVKDVGEPLSTIVAARENHGIVAPFMVGTGHTGSTGRGKYVNGQDEPLRTVTTREEHGIAVPFLVPNFGERDGQDPRTHALDEPLPVVTGHGAGNGERSPGGRVHSLDVPLGGITTHHGKSLIFPFLTEYYGTGGARETSDPLSTVTTKHRHGLAMVQLIGTMQELGVVDIGFRMLEPHELAAAQGFPAGYQIFGSKADQVKQIGNSVHVDVSRAICRAIGEAV